MPVSLMQQAFQGGSSALGAFSPWLAIGFFLYLVYKVAGDILDDTVDEEAKHWRNILTGGPALVVAAVLIALNVMTVSVSEIFGVAGQYMGMMLEVLVPLLVSFLFGSIIAVIVKLVKGEQMWEGL